MNKQKKVFLIIAAIFLLVVLFIVYDIGTRTTFPGGRKAVPEGTDTLEIQEKEGL